ncbi:E3 ubiquitin-protein ligase SHPRH isoform X2 [Hydra vulgaris]|uniref:E3 ubiquitin-protein ligase SHPRH isoform X2 n=1 Tax=Hydra vulgaris TaxID=6087 RepID=UPI0032EA4E38
MSFIFERKNICLKISKCDHSGIKLKNLPLESSRIFTSEELINVINNGSELVINYSEYNFEKLFHVEVVTSSNDNSPILQSGNSLWSGYLQAKLYMIQSLDTAMKKGNILLLPGITNGELEIFVVICKSAFHLITEPDEKSHGTFTGNLKPIFQLLFSLIDDCTQNLYQSSPKLKSTNDLYTYIKHHNSMLTISSNLKNVQHQHLNPTLRKYQVEAVSWMISKENEDFYETGNQNDLHPLWQEIICLDDTKIYFNPYNGRLTLQRFTQDLLPKGGILAEEMGLGKTVEVLACILNNPCPTKYFHDDQNIKNKEKSFDDIRIANKENDKLITDCCNFEGLIPNEIDKSRKIDNLFPKEHDDLLPSKHDDLLPSKHDDLLPRKYNLLPSKHDDLLPTEQDDLLPSEYDGLLPAKRLKYDNSFFLSEFEILNKNGIENNNDLLKCTTCDLCGNSNDNTKIVCQECKVIMHKECAGFVNLNVKNHFCPLCVVKQITETHCTLIVCPDTLLTQWVLEIEKHVKKDTLKYMVYKGIKQHKFIQPIYLAEYDIILTSFNTLRLDFNYVLAESANFSLRYKKRYVNVPCPLIALKFWRMCIDEAQMVECRSTKLVEMCLRINACHRWCVTGTPLQKKIDDIYGLLMFLCVKPYNLQFWWRKGLLDYYKAGHHQKLFNLIALITWRNSKEHVGSQLEIPKMSEFVTNLHFSAIEHNFYFKEHEKCRKKIDLKTGLNSLNQSSKLSELHNDKINQILSIMLPLRQACCHPSVVRTNLFFFDKCNITMDRLIEKLISDAKIESEEVHRKLISAINGIAGVEILMNNIPAAIESYEQAISSWKNNSDIKTDNLQKLHTLFNLHEILTTFEKSKYDEHCLIEMHRETEQLRCKYIEGIKNDIEISKAELDQVKIEVNEKKNKIDFDNPWWLQLLIYTNDNGFYENFINKVKGDFITSLSVNSLSCLTYEIQRNIDKQELTRKEIYTELNDIAKFPDLFCVRNVADCCLQSNKNVGSGSCNFCNFERRLELYELMLFSQRCFQSSENEKVSGLRLETEMEKLFKVILSFAKTIDASLSILNQGKEYMKYVDALKKEFKCLRIQFLFYYRQLQLLDELNMCTMRVQLKQNSEENSYTLDGQKLTQYRLLYESEKEAASLELAKRKGQLLYLQNLATVQTDQEGYNHEICPICVDKLGVQWAVFNCGHCICCQCLVELQKHPVSNARCQVIKCPVCRTANNHVSIVVTKQKKPDSFDAHITYKGSHSTKIGAIVRRILWIHEQDSSSKVLVFSSWHTVLNLLSLALKENNVVFRILQGGGNKFQAYLEEFKQSLSINVLLLPIQAGAKGLNIIEATHVIFVEPVLNIGEELQAVGRVHRIGQTKLTFIHRFIICDTIEEKIVEFFKDKQDKSQVLFHSSLIEKL